MAFWLFKSEPSTWSWQDQTAKGAAGEAWDGVRNYQARNFMRQMQIGDRGFFYHSQGEKSIIGLVEVIQAAQQDPTTDDLKWQCVTIKALQALPNAVSLHQIKALPALANMMLVCNPRLSVQPVRVEEWRIILEISGLNPAG
jgi:predicted RNA-binding protein with PUA-like domain